MVYKGYLIRTTLTGETFIAQGGQHICWAKNVEDAKRIIDTDLGGK